MSASDIPKMKLWYYPQYRSVRCAWMIKELELDDKVEYICAPIKLPASSPQKKDYIKNVHPHGTVPALKIDGHPSILESSAICMYLADLCYQRVPEPKKRDEYYNWIQYAVCRMDGPMEILTRQWWFGPKDKQDPEVIAKQEEILKVCFDRVDNLLKERTFILGDELTAADCVLGYNLLWASLPDMNEGSLLKGRNNIHAYLVRINARPALIGALALPLVE